MALEGACAEITRRVLAWDEVTSVPHSRGGTEFRVRDLEIGHVHGDKFADVPFPKHHARRLVASGRADKHPVSSRSVRANLDRPEDVDRAVALLRESFERLTRPWLRLWPWRHPSASA